MVRTGGRAKPRVSYSYNDEEESDYEANGADSESEEESPPPPPPKKAYSKKIKTPPKPPPIEENSDEEGEESDSYEKEPPKKTSKKYESKKQKNKSAPKVIYKDEETSDDFVDDGEVDNGMDSDYEEPVAKKNTPKKVAKKKTPAKKAAKTASAKKKSAKKKTPVAASRVSGRAAKKIKYSYSDDEDQQSEEEYSSEESSPEPPPAKSKGKAASKAKQWGKPKAVKSKRPQHPPVSEMVPSAITVLRDHPRKGSSLAAIKGVMAEEWGADVKSLASKIKNYITNAVADGELIQTKGKGASGRFTVPGLKVKRKKKQAKLTKKWDEELEPEYQPQKSARAEAREKYEAELEQRREERKQAEARKAEERAKQPKKIVVRKEFWEVEAIKAMKMVNEKTWYQVLFEGSKKPQWEPEDNLAGCRELIDNFLMEEKLRLVQEEEKRRREEEEGKYEVQRILEVKFKKGEAREFLIRWKGHGEDMDSWEPEDNLDCKDLIGKFMQKWEARVNANEKHLRLAPKKVERLQFANSRRVGKRNQGFRVTYEDMDDADI